ncbi:MAG: DNA-binding protein [Clostridia bacterium]|nr:DNA-binding protein [Clostridia bacterium]
MFEKNLEIGFLLDFYGDVLSERKRTVLDYYYNNDLSLAEIAEEIGISRQGVRELIKKSADELLFYEEKLGLAKRFRAAEGQAKALLAMMERAEVSDGILAAARELMETVKG